MCSRRRCPASAAGSRRHRRRRQTAAGWDRAAPSPTRSTADAAVAAAGVAAAAIIAAAGTAGCAADCTAAPLPLRQASSKDDSVSHRNIMKPLPGIKLVTI